MQGNPDGGYVGAAFKKAIFDVRILRNAYASVLLYLTLSQESFVVCRCLPC